MKIFKSYNIMYNKQVDKYQIILIQKLRGALFKYMNNFLELNETLLIHICNELQIDYSNIIGGNIEYGYNGALLFNTKDCKEIKECIELIEQYMLLEKLTNNL